MLNVTARKFSFKSLATHWAHSEGSDQTGRLVWVFAGRTFVGFVMSWLMSLLSGVEKWSQFLSKSAVVKQVSFS